MRLNKKTLISVFFLKRIIGELSKNRSKTPLFSHGDIIIQQVIIPIALKQHQQKKIQQKTLLLMSELVKPKAKKIKETMTCNKFGKLEKNKKSS